MMDDYYGCQLEQQKNRMVKQERRWGLRHVITYPVLCKGQSTSVRPAHGSRCCQCPAHITLASPLRTESCFLRIPQTLCPGGFLLVCLVSGCRSPFHNHLGQATGVGGPGPLAATCSYQGPGIGREMLYLPLSGNSHVPHCFSKFSAVFLGALPSLEPLLSNRASGEGGFHLQCGSTLLNIPSIFWLSPLPYFTPSLPCWCFLGSFHK